MGMRECVLLLRVDWLPGKATERCLAAQGPYGLQLNSAIWFDLSYRCLPCELQPPRADRRDQEELGSTQQVGTGGQDGR